MVARTLTTVIPRLSAVREMLTAHGGEADRAAKNSAYHLALYYGYIAPEWESEFAGRLARRVAEHTRLFADSLVPTTGQLMQWDTWFWLHPEKVAGREQVTSSPQFPLTIIGTQDDIIRTIRAGLRPPAPASNLTLMKLKAKALTLKLKLQQQQAAPNLGTLGLGGLAGLLAGPGLSGLGELSDATRAAVGSSALALRAVLDQARQERSYSATDKLGFDEVLRLYNPGISEDDIRAWVWFRRSIGVPMGGGWKKFYLAGKGKVVQLTTRQTTEILDNGRRVIATVPAGVLLGKWVKDAPEYRGITYRIFRTDDNAIRFVDAAHVKEVEIRDSANAADLDRLVRAGSLFYVGGELLPYPLYAFGNMYDRELELKADEQTLVSRYGREVYEQHAAVIKAARPRLLSVQNPDPRERLKLLAISEFARDTRLFAVTRLREEYEEVAQKARELLRLADEAPLSLHWLFYHWLDTLPPTDFNEVKAGEIKRYYLEKGNLSKTLSDAQKQTIELFAGQEGEVLFSRFLHECLTFDDQQKLDFTWNRTFNAQASVPYHRVPVGFECSARFKRGLLQFTPAQREAIAFLETTGSGILAYDVGVGKTMSAIITVANALYAGKCERPLIAVPNPTYAKWVREIIGYEDKATGEFIPGVLSNTGITLNEWYNLGADVPEAARLLLGKVQVAARSITVVTYEGLAKIGLSSKALGIVAKELDDILNQTGAAEKTARGKEKKRQSAVEIVGGANAGTICDLDALGFDYLVVDEAHNFKNVFDQVPTDENGKKRFAISGSTSARAQKLFFLANYVQRRHGRNVLLLTATPFTNSPLEIYSMLSLVGYETMVRMGLTNLERFCETFIEQGAEYVATYDNRIDIQPVVKRFNNRLILQKLIFNHIAYKTGEEAGVQRPCKINLPRTSRVENGQVRRLAPAEQVLTYLEMTPVQRANQARIVAALQSRDKDDMGAIFRGMADSLNNALSPYLYAGQPENFRDYVTSSPKLHYVMQCVASVKQWHEQHGTPVSGQVIYMNRGKDYFDYLREWLFVEVGYQREVKHHGRRFAEVEIISSGLSADKKEGIKEAFLAGVVKVLIGTATIREGIDLQTRGTVLYNCYPDWNPTDVKQLEGRIWRQGNEFGFVRVVLPLVQNSMDVFVFQKLEEKTSRVNDLWYRGDRGNVLDQESLDPEEVKFALLTDVRQLVRLEIDRLVKEARRRYEVAAQDLKATREYEATRNSYLDYRQQLRLWLLRQLAPATNAYDPRISALPAKLAQQPAWLNQLTEFQRANYPKRVARWLLEAQAWVDAPDGTDLELNDLVRSGGELLQTAQLSYAGANYPLQKFQEALASARKAEKTFLKNKNLTLADDPAALLAALVAEVDRLKAEMQRLASDPEVHVDITREVEARKARLQIAGAGLDERVAEFARLNHLLGIKSGAASTCDIPAASRELPAAPPAQSNKLNLLKFKAKALKIKLRLQAQAAS